MGCLAVTLLGQLGYSVVASTGKQEQAAWLRELGVSRVISREELNDDSERPMLSGIWSGAVDTVGGNTLATIVRQSCTGGCVTACGVVGGSDLSLTVYPFILRGVSLCGIDSASISQQRRREIWNRLAHDWHPKHLNVIGSVVGRNELDAKINEILAGKIKGRVVVDLSK